MIRAATCLIGLLAVNAGSVACAGQGQQTPEGLRARVERLLHRGDAAGALALLERQADDPATAVLRGDARALTGDIAGAQTAFEGASVADGPYRWYARARLAELAERRGALADAIALAADIDRQIDPDSQLGAYDWVAFGVASRLLGSRQPARVKDALGGFDRAIALDSSWIEPQLRVAELFLEKYNAPDARAGFEAVLRRDPDNGRALLGLRAWSAI
jgi:tetratricopeptide (TPR) repeat protein